MTETINNLEFEPINRFMQAGNEIQVCKTNYMGIEILWRTFFPYNIFKDPIDQFSCDLLLPIDTVIENGSIEKEGFYIDADSPVGVPVTNTLEAIIKVIQQFKLNQ
jgi:hypothetical protein